MAWLSERRPRTDGALLPVVVQDDASGDVLMLAWANDEALAATERTGLAHFWSRSRDELWQKGATSGNALRVIAMSADCDEDAVLYRVDPTGPACHTGARSCFDDAGETPGNRADQAAAAGRTLGVAARRSSPPATSFDLRALARLIESRRDADPAGSYTARLLSAGPRRAAEKVVEESGELAGAALAGTEGEVRAEAADLLYHALVLLQSRGISLEAVEETLADRHRAAEPAAGADAAPRAGAG